MSTIRRNDSKATNNTNNFPDKGRPPDADLGQFDGQILLFVPSEVAVLRPGPPAVHGARRHEVDVLRERRVLVLESLRGTEESLGASAAVRGQSGGLTARQAGRPDQVVGDLDDLRRRRGRRLVGADAALASLRAHRDADPRGGLAGHGHSEPQEFVATHYDVRI